MENVYNGLILMVVGMGGVFLFLGILVYLLGLMSRLARWLEARNPSPEPAVSAASPPSVGDGQLTAVISAAVHRYRVGQGK